MTFGGRSPCEALSSTRMILNNLLFLYSFQQDPKRKKIRTKNNIFKIIHFFFFLNNSLLKQGMNKLDKPSMPALPEGLSFGLSSQKCNLVSTYDLCVEGTGTG